jgi:cephalosporin hydroxylase
MNYRKDDRLDFISDCSKNISEMGADTDLRNISNSWLVKSASYKYSYNFSWLGLPIIQHPQDILAIQEIIWETKPDVIIETGVARGGSLILSASILHLLNGNGKVLGIDIDIRPHNKDAIEKHPLASRINLIEGSSIDENIVEKIKKYIKPNDRVMVCLDSNHTHDHVYKELQLYSSLVTKDCYLVVMDSVIEDMPRDQFPDRSWGKGNNPKTAIHEFIRQTERFKIDDFITNKLLITVAPDGYLKCIK